jgi:hypothetical protein
MKNSNPGTAIKCKFSNAVHKILEPNINIPSSQRWRLRKELTTQQKLEMIEQIIKLHNECSSELTSYQYNKREKKRLYKARVERGYKFKKKTKKEDYLKSSEKILA